MTTYKDILNHPTGYCILQKDWNMNHLQHPKLLEYYDTCELLKVDRILKSGLVQIRDKDNNLYKVSVRNIWLQDE